MMAKSWPNPRALNDREFVKWLATCLKDYAYEVVGEMEGGISIIRTSLKYDDFE